jgi:hypothetical protein
VFPNSDNQKQCGYVIRKGIRTIHANHAIAPKKCVLSLWNENKYLLREENCWVIKMKVMATHPTKTTTLACRLKRTRAHL